MFPKIEIGFWMIINMSWGSIILIQLCTGSLEATFSREEQWQSNFMCTQNFYAFFG